MRKVFISSVTMQPATAVKYLGESYPNCKETAYPITIPLDANCQKGDKITMLTIVTHSEGGNKAESNYPSFCNEVRNIVESHEAEVEFVELAVPAKANQGSHRRLYKMIIDNLEAGDKIYADITYGFKYNSIVIFAAINYIYQMADDVDIKEICYGNFYRGEKEPSGDYLDITSLFYLNSLSNMADIGNALTTDLISNLEQ